MSRWLILLIAVTLLALPRLGETTNAISEIGVGAKSKGMGGVGVALPQDAFAAGMNPAGMACVGSRFDAGFGWLWQRGSLTISVDNGVRIPLKSSRGLWLPEGAIAWEFCHCQVVGIAAFTSAAGHTKYNEGPIGGDPNTGALYYNLFVTPSWGWRINSAHSVGVALNLSFDWFNLKGANFFALNSIHPNDVTNRGNNTGEGVSVRIGWMGQFCNQLRVGATFQTQTWSDRHKKYQGVLVNEGYINLPPEMGLGIAWNCLPCVTVAADFVYRVWQASDEFDNTSRQTGTFFANFGASDGPGLGWKNQSIAKVGLAWTPFCCLTLRAGYNYGRSPISSTEHAINGIFLCPQEHHATVGATYRLCCGEFTAFYYHAFQKRAKGEITSETGQIDLTNRQDVAGVSYGICF